METPSGRNKKIILGIYDLTVFAGSHNTCSGYPIFSNSLFILLINGKVFVYINLNRWASIMVIVYSLTATSLIGLSLWLPTKKDENRYTYQPWWIESFAPFYFIKKGAAQEAAETFMKRNSNHRHATRVIAATHHHFKVVKGLSNQRGDLKHNVSLVIIIISTVCLLIASILRAIVVFQARTNFKSGPAAEPVSMYFHGVYLK